MYIKEGGLDFGIIKQCNYGMIMNVMTMIEFQK